jgi:ABC-type branched-subunit amino acid transport system ATPase component
MSDLKLESLRIQNFRTFKDLTIERLGRVNLIVGKNNVGKTSLLEAINLYVRGGTGSSLTDIVGDRQLDALDEYRSTTESEFGVKLPSARHLFFGRPDLSMVGPDDEGSPNSQMISIQSGPERNQPFRMWLELFTDRNSVVDLRVKVGDKQGISSRVLGEKTLSVFLAARDVRAEAEAHWNSIELTKDERRIIDALNFVDKNAEVEDIGFASAEAVEEAHSGSGSKCAEKETGGKERSRENYSKRFPIARLKGRDRPEPLSNLGEGMNRTFALAIGLIRAKNGVLLIDEIENGLHYTVQPDLWRMIFKTARELDVQVFATTHSYDCIQAFQQVAEDYGSSESMLVSLRRREEDPEEIVAVVSDREELGAVVDANIEVR